jgi:hypothetical protein
VRDAGEPRSAGSLGSILSRFATIPPGMTEAPFAAFGRAKRSVFAQVHPRDRCDDHLGDPIPALHDEVFVSQVDQDHLYLSAVIGINRSRRVEQSCPVMQGESAPGAHLRFIPLW